jgi:hypothetical protein
MTIDRRWRLLFNAADRLLAIALSCVVAAGCSPSVGAPGDEGVTAEEEGALTSSFPLSTTVVTTARLRLRTGPSTSYSVLRVLPVNTRLTIVSGPVGGFYRVALSSGAQGFCYGAYLEADSSVPTNPGVDPGATLRDTGSTVFPTSGDIFQARGTGYYPDSSSLEGGFLDTRDQPLRTLQGFLNDRDEYVSVAMDMDPNTRPFQYGQRLRIYELEQKYGRQIEFRVVDTGGAFRGMGRSRIDICTDDFAASNDSTINGTLTIAAVD